MKVGDVVSGLEFTNVTIESFYTELVASGTNEYKEVSMLLVSDKTTNETKSVYVRDVIQIMKRAEEVKPIECKLIGFNPIWEYTFLVDKPELDPKGLASRLKKMGLRGWELTCVTIKDFPDRNGLYIFKRIKKQSGYMRDVNQSTITNCPFINCALNSGQGGCVSTNMIQCKSIPPGFDENKRKGDEEAYGNN